MTTIGSAPTVPDRHDVPAGTMTASEFCRAMQHVDLEVARRHRAQMAAVLVELADDADVPWPATHDDPVVAMLRSLARLTLLAPDSISSSAADLCDRIGPGQWSVTTGTLTEVG